MSSIPASSLLVLLNLAVVENMTAMAGNVKEAMLHDLAPCQDQRSYAICLGSFNFGMDQPMLRSMHSRLYMGRFEHIVATCVQEGGLHIFSGCELGGHLQGFEKAKIQYEDVSIFAQGKGPLASVDSNYMTAWNFHTDASQLSVQKGQTLIHMLSSSHTVEPQLVINTFTVGTDACLIHGNLHIRVPRNSPVTIQTKKELSERLCRS